jgi:hypothetical protein
MLDKLTFTGVQDSIVIKTMKEHVVTKVSGVGMDRFEMFDTIYVITSLKTNEDVSARTVGFASSDVVVANALGRLTQPYGDTNKPAVVNVGSGPYSGHKAISLSVVCQPHIRTVGEEAILNFLRDEVSLSTPFNLVCVGAYLFSHVCRWYPT